MRIPLSLPLVEGSEIGVLQEVINTGFLAPAGPHVDAFENLVGDYYGPNYACLAVSSGTAALHLILEAVGVSDSDGVWITSMTFAGGAFPAVYCGANITFVDLDAKTWSIDVKVLTDRLWEAKLQSNLPKVIIVTDLYGLCTEIEPLEQLCQKYGIYLFFDAAESVGASDAKGRKAGSGGLASIISFNGNKIITSGGGGMIVSKDKNLISLCKKLSTQARDEASHYQHSRIGFNYRMPSVCAALGIAQFRTLERRVQDKKSIFQRYHRELSDKFIDFYPTHSCNPNFWLSAGSLKSNLKLSSQALIEQLSKINIECRPLWKPMHMQPVFDKCTYLGNSNDQHLFERGICLPSSLTMSVDQQNLVISEIVSLLE